MPKFINPSFEILTETNPFRQIEIAGRTCYQSEPKDGDNGEAFFSRLVGRKHFAMTEFANFVFNVFDDNLWSQLVYEKAINDLHGKYLNLSEKDGRRIVSGSVRALNEVCSKNLLTTLMKFENGKFADLCYSLPKNWTFDTDEPKLAELVPTEELPNLLLTREEYLTHTYMTVRFNTNRGVTHEIVRNRPFGFGQESTRYVRYGKNNDPMVFILPCWIVGKERELLLNANTDNLLLMANNLFISVPTMTFVKACIQAEENYAELLANDWVAQQAREVLPNAIKAQICVCGNLDQWRHFLSLRADKYAHPEMKTLMRPLLKQLIADKPEIWQDVADKIDLIN